MNNLNLTGNLNASNAEDVFNDGRGDLEKILAMVVLGLGSVIAGMLPAFISERNRRRFPLSTSLLLCFGAGVLLATALVHILPEVRNQMNSNFAEISLCGGFFIIYFIDEFIHYFFGEAIQHSHGPPATTPNTAVQNNNVVGNISNCHTNRNYGAISNENEPLLHSHSTTSVNHSQEHQQNQTNGSSHQHTDDLMHGVSHTNTSNTHHFCNDETAIAEANARICHTNHTEPCAQAMTGTLGLFVALSLHSAIEGLAIGVQSTATKVLFLLGAVACHKFVMAFCLGLELRSNQATSLRSHFIGIFVFALGAIGGIGIGMLIIDVPSAWTSSTLSVIQALAGGTLFYVTVCEVIPREKSRWHQNTSLKAAGFAQFFAIFCGFALMCVINYYLNDDDS